MTSDIKRFLLWLVVAVVIIGSFLVIMFMSSGGSGINSSGKLTKEVTADDWIKGNPDAKITLIEYSDVQCPACKARLPLIEDVLQEFGNHIRFVYRHFPLRTLHENSQIGAQATEAAGLQGKFWEMHDKLFEQQSAWSNLKGDELKTAFGLYANQIGLDIGKFNSDLNSNAVRDAVNEDYNGGEDAGVNSTPTFFLNYEKISPSDYEEFRKLIREAIDAAAKNAA